MESAITTRLPISLFTGDRDDEWSFKNWGHRRTLVEFYGSRSLDFLDSHARIAILIFHVKAEEVSKSHDKLNVDNITFKIPQRKG